MNSTTIDFSYVTSLEEVGWGATLMAITMVMHGFGVLLILRVNSGLKDWFETKSSHIPSLYLIILASWMILVLHLTEVIVWAAFFLWKGAFPNHSIAYYFSLNEYTTVGSNFSLPQRWRLLEGMLAIAGLLTFAWSTGVLLTLAQEFHEQRPRETKRPRQQESLSKHD